MGDARIAACVLATPEKELGDWLRGTTDLAPPSAAARVVSNPYFTVIAPLPAIRCDCALRSFEITKLFLLLRAESLVDF